MDGHGVPVRLTRRTLRGGPRDRGSPRRPDRIDAGLVLVALAVRVAYVLATTGYSPTHDDLAYDRLARGVARSGSYPLLNGHATAYRPPGYTYFLGLVYRVTGTGSTEITAARLTQCIIGAASVFLLGWLARELFGRPASRWVMGIAALYVPFIAVGSSLLSEGQTVAFELTAVLAVVIWRRRPTWTAIAVAGTAAGLLTLTRSNGVVVLPALAAGVIATAPRSRRSWAAAAGLVALAMALVAPWTIRNEVVMHAFIPVSDEAGGTLAGTYNPVSAGDRAAPGYWHLLSQIPSYRAETSGLAAGPEPAFQGRLLHLALSYAGDHPAYVLKVAAYNTERLAGVESLTDSRYTAGLAGITSPAVADAGTVSFWIVLALAVLGVSLRPLRRAVPGFIWLATGLLYLSIVLVNSEAPRLRLPLDPFVLLLAGAAASFLTGRLRRVVPVGAFWHDGDDGESVGWPRSGVGRPATRSRKVGTPQGRVLANGQSR